MNERIKQLYDQCWFAIDTAGYQKDFLIDDSMGYFFDAEKFAELIIRECMSCSQFVGITNDRIGLGPMPIRYTSMVNDQIKKHFGTCLP